MCKGRSNGVREKRRRQVDRVRIRRMKVGDHRFVARLAATQAQFTVPSRYLLWMLCKTQPGLCLIAESGTGRRLGYVLGLFAGASGGAIFLWQLAVTPGAQSAGVGRALAFQLGDLARRRNVSEIRFTVIPHSSSVRWARDAAGSLLNQPVEVLSRVPKAVNDLERECRIRVLADVKHKSGRRKGMVNPRTRG